MLTLNSYCLYTGIQQFYKFLFLDMFIKTKYLHQLKGEVLELFKVYIICKILGA